MANTNVSNQYYVTGRQSLDAKLQPVDSFNDLKKITAKDRYVGMTVVVLNAVRDEEGYIVSTNPIDYWLVDGVTNACWKVKSSNTTVQNYQALLALTLSEAYVGMERVVIADETNNNEMTKYWVTSIDGENITWERKQATVNISGEDVEN